MTTVQVAKELRDAGLRYRLEARKEMLGKVQPRIIDCPDDGLPAQCFFAETASYGCAVPMGPLLRAAFTWHEQGLQPIMHGLSLIRHRVIRRRFAGPAAVRRFFDNEDLLAEMRTAVIDAAFDDTEKAWTTKQADACAKADHPLIQRRKGPKCERCIHDWQLRVLAMVFNIGPFAANPGVLEDTMSALQFLEENDMVRSLVAAADPLRAAHISQITQCCIRDMQIPQLDILNHWHISIRLWSATPPGTHESHPDFNPTNVADISTPPWQVASDHGLAGPADRTLGLKYGQVGFIATSALELAAKRRKEANRWLENFRIDTLADLPDAVKTGEEEMGNRIELVAPPWYAVGFHWALLHVSYIDASGFLPYAAVDLCRGRSQLAYGTVVSLPALMLAAEARFFHQPLVQELKSVHRLCLSRLSCDGKVPERIMQRIEGFIVAAHLPDYREVMFKRSAKAVGIDVDSPSVLKAKATKRRVRATQEMILYSYAYTDVDHLQRTREYIDKFLEIHGFSANLRSMPLHPAHVDSSKLAPGAAYQAITLNFGRADAFVERSRVHLAQSKLDRTSQDMHQVSARVAGDDYRNDMFALTARGTSSMATSMDRFMLYPELGYGDDRGYVERFVEIWQLRFESDDAVSAGTLFGSPEEAAKVRSGEAKLPTGADQIGWMVMTEVERDLERR